MNFLLLYQSEIASDGVAVITGERVVAYAEEHPLKIGDRLPLVIYGERCGEACVKETSKDRLVVQVVARTAGPQKLPVHCIVGVCRPQTVKKVIQIAATTGVASVCFVGAENSEKSYLQSKALTEEQIASEIAKGLAQCGDPIPPQICVQRTFSWYLREHLAPQLSKYDQWHGFVADTHFPNRATLSTSSQLPTGKPVFVAIGPENGWASGEVASLVGLGFCPLDLGPRILRVETALNILLGQILLLAT